MTRLAIAATLIFAFLPAATALAQEQSQNITVTYDAKGQPNGVAIDHIWIERICFTDKPPYCGPVLKKIAPEKIEEAKKQLGIM
ncbi:hypothetical protein ELG72_33385 (plasmid) [Rhizobium leguminosarum]|uniref:hypothetical protein n=1 Tax=Rhizobium leguminosarum TaxID=384 RepID=UPI00102F7160|nr:hypothetical protein [Rhizobium leguminosarum]TBF43442.1 hypothetical protein ELG91_35030 [Rhizobium leguminosarum]TBF46262.1 hypothetical protein ELG87_33840 [Rhizobium leguminosarum]TBF47679.1 hypothetical protein ELG90_31395 [Rhizobium leguminosarum]TBF65154.1 hypothetical protein ELG84_34365 [Rhizobium leguminosarum]TBF67313.1 hypothetical protein ELG89_30150 [Rhizobium leguminosarum]